MSRRPNVTLIGGFVVGAVCIGVIALAYLGTLRFAKESKEFVLFFDESVNGLEIGGKVKFKGVPIGLVKKVLLRLPGQSPESSHIPVLIEIDTETLRDLGAIKFQDTGGNDLAEMIDMGLRAQLRLDNMITGLYYIEVDFRENAKNPEFQLDSNATDLAEIPTIPSPFAALGQSVDQIIAAIGSAGVDKLVRDAVEIIDQINIKLIEMDVIEISVRMTDALEAVEKRFSDPQLDVAVEKVNMNLDALHKRINDDKLDTILDNLNSTLDSIQERVKDPAIGNTIAQAEASFSGLNTLVANANAEVTPALADVRLVVKNLQQGLGEFRTTMQHLDATNSQLQYLLSSDSSVRYRFEHAMKEFAAAAQSIRTLAEFLERNPSAIVTGKPDSP